MRVIREDDHFLLSLARGEEVPQQLTRWCREQGFGHATLSGIGALEGITIGAYDLAKRVYLKQELEGGWEVLALNGNFSWISGEGMLHTHLSLADLDCRVRGGHLFAATVHITLEIVLRPGKTRVERSLDEECGLNLWNFDA